MGDSLCMVNMLLNTSLNCYVGQHSDAKREYLQVLQKSSTASGYCRFFASASI